MYRHAAPRPSRFLAGLIAILIAILFHGSSQAAGPSREAIDAVFADYDTTRTPGCSLAVYQGDQVTHARGYGMANLEYGIALAPDSVFRLASVSKQFMAAAIALLDEAGELDLDDPVQQYFPALPDYGKPITLRHLIHHTSGIRDYLDLAWLADWGEGYLPGEALRLIERQQGLNFEPGSEYLYSNSGYLMLADIVEQVTGQSLRDWSEEHLFGPLGMDDTHFHDDHRRIVPRRATGYAPREDGWEISMTQLDMVGDGGVISTVLDLQRWHDNFTDNQLGRERAAFIKLMETPAELTSGESTDYGFGLGINDFLGTREVEHSGSWVGYRTALHRYPEHDLGVAVLCNRADANPTARARSVAALYLAGDTGGEKGGAGADRAAGPTAPGPAQSGVTLSEAALQRHVGAYWNEADLTRRFIVLEAGTLYYDRDGWSRSPLVPRDENTFLMGDAPLPTELRFADDTLSISAADGEAWVLERYTPDAPDADALAAFTGTYYSQELDHEQVLAVEDGELVAHRRAGPTPLEPVPGQRFISNGVVVAFDRDPAAGVNGFSVNSGRVRNIAYTRRSGGESEVLALADAALEAISNEDPAALTGLMMEGAMVYGSGIRDGERRIIARSRDEERLLTTDVDILERGFDPEVRVSGSTAMVWYPYDLWADGEWIHCGVDIFSFLQTDDGWRIASIAFSMDQPPVCSMHPDGPPEQ
ncbi:MAG: serine hydrolase domain-containing protein [Xanthomonadales bacterium]|jgi:CubicO group peptidase (beta-lactamase class C family)|nr:serine hydrolase domain-containing protein [Xanthomonadales bacterium]